MQTLKKSISFGVAVVLFLIVACLAGWMMTGQTFGAAGTQQSTILEHHYQPFTFFTATTTTATSTNSTDTLGMDVKGAKKIALYFTHGGTATTSTSGTTFTVQGSPDAGETWVYISRLLGSDVSQTATSSVAMQGATSTQAFFIDLEFKPFDRIRVISTEFAGALATDGEHTVTAYAEY